MNDMKKEDMRLLGLGSILKAQTAETTDGALYVVVARALLPEGEGFTARYRVAPHPFGDAADQTLLVVREDEIREVVFEGYLDGADQAFLEDLVAKIGKAARKPESKAMGTTAGAAASTAAPNPGAAQGGTPKSAARQTSQEADAPAADGTGGAEKAAPKAEDLFARFR